MLITSDSLSISLRVLLSSPKGPNSIQDCSKAGKLLKFREQRPLLLLLHNCIYLGSSPVYAVSKNGTLKHKWKRYHCSAHFKETPLLLPTLCSENKMMGVMRRKLQNVF